MMSPDHLPKGEDEAGKEQGSCCRQTRARVGSSNDGSDDILPFRSFPFLATGD